MFKKKDGSVVDQLKIGDFIKLMVPDNYEIHPVDQMQLMSKTVGFSKLMNTFVG